MQHFLTPTIDRLYKHSMQGVINYIVAVLGYCKIGWRDIRRHQKGSSLCAAQIVNFFMYGYVPIQVYSGKDGAYLHGLVDILQYHA